MDTPLPNVSTLPASPATPASSALQMHDEDTTDLLQLLRFKNLRITPIRVAMLASLRRHTRPITLREMREELGAESIPFVTLFRCMRRFEQAHLVRRMIGAKGTVGWELKRDQPQQFHVTSRDSGETVQIDADAANELRALLKKVEQDLQQRGYGDLELNVAFYGERRASQTQTQTPAQRRRVA